MHTLLQFTIYAVAHSALALWRIIPGLLATAALYALLALGENSPAILHYLTH